MNDDVRYYREMAKRRWQPKRRFYYKIKTATGFNKILDMT